MEFDGPPYEAAPSPGIDPDHAAYTVERAEANLAAAQKKVEVAKSQLEGAKDAVAVAKEQLSQAQETLKESETNSSVPGDDSSEAHAGAAETASESPQVGG